LVRIDAEKDISCRMLGAPGTAPELYNNGIVTQYCSLAKDGENYQVMKSGRTTGWTTGKVSSVPSVITLQGRGVLVYTIVGKKKRIPFLEPGDIGSLVLLDQRQASKVSGEAIVGLGFAAAETSGASYMITMHLIIDHIEHVTNGKVIEPRYAGTV
jgi:hypothetical protein